MNSGINSFGGKVQMGRTVKVGEEQKKSGSGCLSSILVLLVFTALLGTYALHQCALWQEITYKLPAADELLDKLQSALTAYNAGSEMNIYPVGELSYYELTAAISPYFSRENDIRYYHLNSFKYNSRDGITYRITAQLDTVKETIFTRTPDDGQ